MVGQVLLTYLRSYRDNNFALLRRAMPCLHQWAATLQEIASRRRATLSQRKLELITGVLQHLNAMGVPWKDDDVEALVAAAIGGDEAGIYMFAALLLKGCADETGETTSEEEAVAETNTSTGATAPEHRDLAAEPFNGSSLPGTSDGS